MAEEVEMTPVAAEPANGVSPQAPASAKPNPVIRKPGMPTAALKPGLKLPPKPGATVALKPGLKLPPKPGMPTAALKPGLKLPPKPGATVAAFRPGLKLPTQTALKPGLKLPTKPVIGKPGATVATAPLPKPIAPATPAAAAASAPTPAPVAESKPVESVAAAPVAEVKPVVAELPKAEEPRPVPPPIVKPIPSAEPKAEAASQPAPVAKPVAVDAQGVGKLPTVEAKAVPRDDAAPAVSENPNPMAQLKSVTQKLKGITQEIPAQAVLRKTGIIAENAMSTAQKEAVKHKTARISLSEAIGVSPVKNENAPMKTIRIRRPIDIPNATKPLSPQPKPAVPAATDTQAETKISDPEAPAEAPAATITQRKTLKIARPGGGMVRPSGKFGIKRPGSTAATKSAAPAEATASNVAPAEAAGGAVADIPEMPPVTAIPDLPAAPAASDGPMWLFTLSTLVQAAACVAMGALAWFLYQNTQVAYF